MESDLLSLAAEYHRALPGRIRQYLYRRGIPDLLIDFHLLGWNGSRIADHCDDPDGQRSAMRPQQVDDLELPPPGPGASRG